MKLTQIIAILILSACQKPNKISGDCGSRVKVEIDPSRIKRIETQKIKYFGGLLFAKYSDDFKNSYIGEHEESVEKFDIKYASIFKDKSCTAAFEPIKFNSDSVEFIVWTAKHCLFYQGVEDIKTYMFVNNEYLEVPMKLDLIENAKAARNLFISSKGFSHLYFFGDSPSHWQARKPEHGYLGASDKRFFKEFNKELLREEVVFGRQLCTVFVDKDLMLEYQGHKICYLYQDLNAFNASIPLSFFNHSETPLRQSIYEQIDQRQKLNNANEKNSELLKTWRHLKLAKVWHEHGYRLNRMFYGLQFYCKEEMMKSDSVCLEMNKKILSIKEYAASIDKIFSKLSGQDRVYRDREITDISSITDQSILIMQEQQLAKDIGHSWNEIYENILAKNAEDLWFHANYFFKGSNSATLSGFLSTPYSRAFGKQPLLFRQYGFVHFLSDKNLKVRPGDSGSHLSYLGITPIAAISTVDDDDVSGGVSRTVLPQKESENNSKSLPTSTSNNESKTSPEDKKSTNQDRDLSADNMDDSSDFTYIAKDSIIGAQILNETAQCR